MARALAAHLPAAASAQFSAFDGIHGVSHATSPDTFTLAKTYL
jgi:hypothetical protein